MLCGVFFCSCASCLHHGASPNSRQRVFRACHHVKKDICWKDRRIPDLRSHCHVLPWRFYLAAYFTAAWPEFRIGCSHRPERFLAERVSPSITTLTTKQLDNSALLLYCRTTTTDTRGTRGTAADDLPQLTNLRFGAGTVRWA